jgi:hypothetical protein
MDDTNVQRDKEPCEATSIDTLGLPLLTLQNVKLHRRFILFEQHAADGGAYQ